MHRELKPCPFCGWQAGDDLMDVVYPTGSYAHWIDSDHHNSGLHFNGEREGAVHEVYHVGCTENMGGCGASVLGLDREGAVTAWNRRVAPGVDAPRKITSLAEFCAEGERLGLTAFDLAEALKDRPEFADCKPAAGVPAAPAPSCEWREEDPDGYTPGTYASACGELWSFNDGGPKENHVRFCQGCGKPVQIMPFVAEPDPDDTDGVMGLHNDQGEKNGV